MKIIFTVTLALVLSMLHLSSSAQEKRYIETIVSDTIMLKPILIKYQISSGEQAYSFDYDYPKDPADAASTPAKAESLDDISLALKKEKFTFALNSENNYTITKGVESKPSLMVTLKSTAELDKLTKVLGTYKGISGKISSIDYESPVPYNDAMFKRLYEKAFSEATSLAKISGFTADRLVCATEIGDQYGGYMDWIMELSKTAGQYDLYGMNTGLTKVYSRKFSFRFELK